MAEKNQDTRTDSGLLSETRRVLDKQTQLIQKQQEQAMRVIRILLTALGLILTVFSVLLSSELINIGSIRSAVLAAYAGDYNNISESIVFISLFFSFIFLGRVLYFSLSIISPTADTGGITGKILKSIFTEYDPIARIGPHDGAKHAEDDKELSDITPQAGISESEAKEALAVAESETESAIIKYNIDHIRSNNIIIEKNRTNLKSMYRTIAIMILYFGIILLGLPDLFS